MGKPLASGRAEMMAQKSGDGPETRIIPVRLISARLSAAAGYPPKAGMPVWARPRISAWMSCVPS